MPNKSQKYFRYGFKLLRKMVDGERCLIMDFGW